MSLNRDQTTHNLSVSEQLIINSSNLELNEAIGQGEMMFRFVLPVYATEAYRKAS